MTTAPVHVQPGPTEVQVPPIQQPAPEPQQPPASASAPITDLPEGDLPRGVLQIPSNAMSEIRKKERERGQKAQMKRLDDQARTLGYKSHDDMIAQLSSRQGKQGKQKPAHAAPAKPSAPARTEPAPATTTAPEERVTRREQRNERDNAEAVRAANARAAKERSLRKKLERDVQAAKAEGILRSSAVRAGILDVDYALHLLRGHVRTLDQKGLRSFDEMRYFADLRSTHPAIFGGGAAPLATTGPSGSPEPSRGAPPVAPAGSAHPPAAPANGGKGVRDARTMTPEQTNARLRELGLSPIGSSMPV